MMQVLTVDVGTGTQDIFLFRSGIGLENGFKLVLPSPTMIVRDRIREATRRGGSLLLTGVMMGGGPCSWAAEEHLQAGYPLFATADAARTFNDDLDWVQREMGVELVSEEEAANLDDLHHIEMRDFDYRLITELFTAAGVHLDPRAVAVAVFDHGDAPPHRSDRQFRFDYLKRRIRAENRLSAFAYRSQDVPTIMGRMRAVARSAPELDCPLVVMDTAPAAVLGANLDPRVLSRQRALITNIGNFHTLAFRLGPTGIEGLFEHHTGEIDLPRLESLLEALAAGSLTHEEVFDDNGHGALITHAEPLPLRTGDFDVAVTGPRRSMMAASRLQTHFAVPYGDMMLTGCFGLLAAVADHVPSLRESILAALRGAGADTAPWDR